MAMIMHENSPGEHNLDGAGPNRLNSLQKFCVHCESTCDESSVISSVGIDGESIGGASECIYFCCHGCEAAWRTIHGLGLECFYEMQAASEGTKTTSTAKPRSFDYGIYDSPDFQLSFVMSKVADHRNSVSIDPMGQEADVKVANLLIDGITCYACIWLIQNALERTFRSARGGKLPLAVAINQTTGVAQISWDESLIKLSKIVEFIENLGYRVAPNRLGSLKADHSEMVRVGVGLFLMMNVMSFAVAEYFAGPEGLNAQLQFFMRWISFAMTLLALVWPGREFFSNTWRTIKYRSPSIDAPITLGLLAAFVWSVRNTILGAGPVYYDSISAIIAFVMTGRMIQKNVIRRNQSKIGALVNPGDGWTLVRKGSAGGEWEPYKITSIKKGDTLRILPGEMLPLRGLCVSTCASISFEQLKGEAGWQSFKQGESIPAGAVNGSEPLEVVAAQDGVQSYTESLARSIDKVIHEKGLYSQWSDRAAWALFLAVLMVALLIFLIVAPDDPETAVSRVVALMLVACPCTFAIGVPLVFGTALSRALHDGVLFKSQRAVEVLAEIKQLVFDKTGTLTEGVLSVHHIDWQSDVSDEVKTKALRYFATLAEYSSHHVPVAIARHAKKMMVGQLPVASEACEHQSAGMELKFGADHLLIGSPKFISKKLEHTSQQKNQVDSVLVALNGELIASLELADKVRSSAKDLIKSLKFMVDSIDLLSGDSSAKTALTARELLIDARRAHGEASPASKMLFVRRAGEHQGVAMIGNGLNDSGAMAQADISIAVDGASSTAMRSADVCLLRSDVGLIGLAIKYARAAQRRIRLVFVVATVYNLIGIYLAARGLVSPVVAAVLMPVSSLTITYLSTSWTVGTGILDAKIVNDA